MTTPPSSPTSGPISGPEMEDAAVSGPTGGVGRSRATSQPIPIPGAVLRLRAPSLRGVDDANYGASAPMTGREAMEEVVRDRMAAIHHENFQERQAEQAEWFAEQATHDNANANASVPGGVHVPANFNALNDVNAHDTTAQSPDENTSTPPGLTSRSTMTENAQNQNTQAQTMAAENSEIDSTSEYGEADTAPPAGMIPVPRTRIFRRDGTEVTFEELLDQVELMMNNLDVAPMVAVGPIGGDQVQDGGGRTPREVRLEELDDFFGINEDNDNDNDNADVDVDDDEADADEFFDADDFFFDANEYNGNADADDDVNDANDDETNANADDEADDDADDEADDDADDEADDAADDEANGE
ncbi:hypothetical protein GGR56DRAFT_677030 [Xylariaceae sp. FL0804]|nr:hypothetical protein GGR56DRAFT_677030 [Xylariaceae sp. FL0804]